MVDFPAVSDLLLWVDGRAPAYSDAAASIVASPYAGRVRRTNYGSTAVGSAQAPNDNVRPYRETNALNFQIGGGHYMAAPVASNCTQNAVTIALAFSMRDKPAGTQQSLLCNGAVLRVWTFSDNVIAVNYNNTVNNWYIGPSGLLDSSSARTPLGAQIELVLRISATGMKASVVVDGARTDYVTPGGQVNASATTLPAANWYLGWDGFTPSNFDSLTHGAIAQAALIGHVSSDSEVNDILASLRANPAPHFCPPEVPLFIVSGDSIAAASAGFYGVPVSQRWSSVAQQMLNATQPVNVVNGAVSGTWINQQRTEVFPLLSPFYSEARAKNAFILAAGTNDIATLGHSGATTLADQYAYAGAVLAAGFKPFLCTIPARNPGGGFDVANFNTHAGYYNTHLRAEAAGLGYGLIDFAAIPQAADPTNPTYFSDGIHPTIALQALMGQVAAAEIQAYLSRSGVELVVERAHDVSRSPPTFVFSLPHLN